MAVNKNYLNEKKTKFNWRVVVHIPTGEYDRFGKPKKKHKHVGYYSTKSEGEIAERNFWNEFEACTLELNKDATIKAVIINFLDYAKNEGRYAKGTISNYEGYLKNHFQMLQHVPIKNLTPALIQKWRRELFTKGASDHVFNGCIKLAKAAFNYAIELKQVNTNPFKDRENVNAPALSSITLASSITSRTSAIFSSRSSFNSTILLSRDLITLALSSKLMFVVITLFVIIVAPYVMYLLKKQRPLLTLS